MTLALLTQDELSAETGVPVRTLEGWRCYGGGPVFRKLGRHVRYRRDDVDAWISGKSANPAPHRRPRRRPRAVA